MTLLELMVQTNIMCGLQGDIDTVANLKDIQTDLYNFVRNAHLKIQVESDEWKFMNLTMTLAVDGTTVSTPATGVAKWKRLICNKQVLTEVPYDDYLLDDWTSPGPPSRYTVVPSTNELIINTLDKAYTVIAQYLRTPKDLVNNLDTPVLPERFHMLVAYQAAADFGSWLGNPEIEDKNLTNADVMMGQLKRSELPHKTVSSRPLA